MKRLMFAVFAICIMACQPIYAETCQGTACNLTTDDNMFSLNRIVIPAISVDRAVEKVEFSEELQTWDISDLAGAFYWLDGTPHPEEGGNTVLSAHYLEHGLPGPLNRVRDLQEGDEIILYSDKRQYVYLVEKYQYVLIDYSEPLKYRPYSITLSTCANFNWDTGDWEARVVVLGKLDSISVCSN